MAREQGVGVAIGEVRAPDGAVEQHVPKDGEAVVVVDEHDVAGRVAGAVQHVEPVGAEGDHVAFVQPAVGADRAGAFDAVAGAGGREVIQQEGVTLVRAFQRRTVDGVLQGRGTPGMIEVAMREQDALDRQAELGDGAEDGGHVPAGVHDEGGLGGVIPDERAVLLQRGDRDDSDLEARHGGVRANGSGIYGQSSPASKRPALHRRLRLRIFANSG